tara:strand:+ start:1515 stop:1715 length:201 start_codon:yes stop_codon:yes gene_type:complete
MSKKKENKYKNMQDRCDKFDKSLEDMCNRINELKEYCETSEFDTEEVDPLLDFEDLFIPDLNRVKK